MKILCFVFTFLLCNHWIWAQQTPPDSSRSTEFRKLNERIEISKDESPVLTVSKFPEMNPADSRFETSNADFEFDKKIPDVVRINEFTQKISAERFHWKPALIQSGIFLGVQHTFRLFQKKTRDEFGGKFFNDWGKSIKNIHGWNDGDNFFTNYIAHPIQGGITGRIFVNNSDRAKKYEFGRSKIYWESRLKAFFWSIFWSAQFEIGPVSEATIGNVGLHRKNGFSTGAWVDLVMTPVVGTGVVILEDIFEKYVLKNFIERKFKNKNVIKFFRILFAPTTSFGSILRGNYPWWREGRPL